MGGAAKTARGNMLPEATVIVRTYNDRATVGRALRSAFSQTYANCRVLVVHDTDSTDGTIEAVGRFLSHDPSVKGRAWSMAPVAHTTCWGAFQAALMMVDDAEYIFVLDADNTMPPTRVADQIAIHPSAPGACTGVIRHVTPRGKVLATRPTDPTVNYTKLLRYNRYDNLSIMYRGFWARERLLPAMREADRWISGEKVEDYFGVLVAARDGVLCHHPSLVCGNYAVRPGAQSRRRDPMVPTRNTLQAAPMVLSVANDPEV